jgi:hypothetical protein
VATGSGKKLLLPRSSSGPSVRSGTATCSQAGVKVAACSGARVEAAACFKAEVEDGSGGSGVQGDRGTEMAAMGVWKVC